MVWEFFLSPTTNKQEYLSIFSPYQIKFFQDDLTRLKDQWSEALAKRKEYLDRQLKAIMHKSDKTEAENEREQLLVDQCVFLTEEQEYVMVPAPGSGVPGKI